MELLTAYLRRDVLDSADPASLTLADLVAALNRTLPFENLVPLACAPVDDLPWATLTDKLVRGGRGGYCYEHNTLLGHVLRALGHQVHFLTGRVEWMGSGDPVPPRTHEVLAVTPPGAEEQYLVDVGFGGQTPTAPVLLHSDEGQRTRHEPVRLHPRGSWRVLETLVRGRWEPMYAFDLQPQELVDLEVGSWYVSTHPASPFVRGLRVARVRDDARVNLNGRSLAVHHLHGDTERTELTGPAEVTEALATTFGIDLSGFADPERVVSEVLVAA